MARTTKTLTVSLPPGSMRRSNGWPGWNEKPRASFFAIWSLSMKDISMMSAGIDSAASAGDGEKIRAVFRADIEKLVHEARGIRD